MAILFWIRTTGFGSIIWLSNEIRIITWYYYILYKVPIREGIIGTFSLADQFAFLTTKNAYFSLLFSCFFVPMARVPICMHAYTTPTSSVDHVEEDDGMSQSRTGLRRIASASGVVSWTKKRSIKYNSFFLIIISSSFPRCCCFEDVLCAVFEKVQLRQAYIGV